MLECYLQVDSKGVIPRDFESNADYVLRGEVITSYKYDAGRSDVLKVATDELSKGHSFVEASAPAGLYDLMVRKFDCDLRWVPYFQATGRNILQRIIDNYIAMGFMGEFSYHNKDGYFLIPTVNVMTSAYEREIAVHEFIHAVRSTMGLSSNITMEGLFGLSRDIIMEELFAMCNEGIGFNDEFINLAETIKCASMMYGVRSKLRGCFGEKADYCFIRLKDYDISYLANKSVDDAGVKRYLERNAAVNTHKGRLRFGIMCEKLGL